MLLTKSDIDILQRKYIKAVTMPTKQLKKNKWYGRKTKELTEAQRVKLEGRY